MDFARLLRIAVRKVTLSPSLTRIYDRCHKRLSGRLRLGERGELEAERFLLRKGWFVVERGFKARGGEIDLIAIDGQTIVFIEVKTRASDRKGHPAEAVDHHKQRHLTNTSFAYLKKKRLTGCATRFDVIAIIWPDRGKPTSIEHYQNAFEPTGKFQLV